MAKGFPPSLYEMNMNFVFGWFSVEVRTCFRIISLTQAQEKAGLHTHSHLKFIVGLNKFMRNT